jgi:hypothetical protein
MKSALLSHANSLAVPLVACTFSTLSWAQAVAPAPATPPPPPVIVAPPAPEPPKYPITTISGFVEAAWHLSLDDSSVPGTLFTRAYDTANGFQLHSAHLQLKHQATEHVMGQIEFEAGSDAAVNNFTIAPGGAGPMQRVGTGFGAQLFDVLEAFASYSAEGFTLTAGKFVTYEGIEVVPGPSDPTITRGFLYFLAEPVTHVGAKLHYATGPVDIGVGLVNGWDTNGVFYTSDNNNQKTAIFRVGVTPVPQFWAAASGTYGVEGTNANTNPRLSLDLTGAVIPTDMITINFQGNLGSEKGVGHDPGGLTWADGPVADASWFGFGVQPVVKFGAAAVGARFEYFKDTKGSRTAVANDPSYINFTITPGYTFDGAFTLRGEFRYDSCTEPVLIGASKNQSTVAVSAHYMF